MSEIKYEITKIGVYPSLLRAGQKSQRLVGTIEMQNMTSAIGRQME